MGGGDGQFREFTQRCVAPAGSPNDVHHSGDAMAPLRWTGAGMVEPDPGAEAIVFAYARGWRDGAGVRPTSPPAGHAADYDRGYADGRAAARAAARAEAARVGVTLAVVSVRAGG